MNLIFPQNLRAAAQLLDQSSGATGRQDVALHTDVWEAVLDGSYSLVEWFDTDTRRFIVVRANPPGTVDPRGLTNHERDAASYAALGESNKLIAFRLGVSPGRVSNVLSSVIRKLDLRSKAQLVYWVRGLGMPIDRDRRVGAAYSMKCA